MYLDATGPGDSDVSGTLAEMNAPMQYRQKKIGHSGNSTRIYRKFDRFGRLRGGRNKLTNRKVPSKVMQSKMATDA